MKPAKAFAVIKQAAATITDRLADIGANFPSLSSITISAGGITATVTPSATPPPPASPTCATCGAVVLGGEEGGDA